MVSQIKHYILKCSCGDIISQCKCPAELGAVSANKHVTAIQNGCNKCHQEMPKVIYNSRTGSWIVQRAGQRPIEFTKEEFDYVRNTIHDHYHGEG